MCAEDGYGPVTLALPIPVLTDPATQTTIVNGWRISALSVTSLHVILEALNPVQQGHRTHPAFVHFLTCVVLMAMYMGGVAISGAYYAFTNPMDVVRENRVKMSVY